MKNNILLFITIVSVFSFNCLAQNKKESLSAKKIQSAKIKIQPVSKTKTTSAKTEKKLHVEENINVKFGGYTTTYEVSDPKHVNKTDLGPKNTRVVTPRSVKVKSLEIKTETLRDTLEKHGDYAYVYMLKTYERVAQKGYKSIDIFQKLGNGFYFNAEYEKAARWYGELFALTSDLDSEYYYRYGHSLKSIGKNDKAKEMLEIFRQKTAKDSPHDSSKK